MSDSEMILSLSDALRGTKEELALVRAEQHATERLLLIAERNCATLRYNLSGSDNDRASAASSRERAESDLRDFKAKIHAEVKEPSNLIQRGMRFLDEVKHCRDLMTPDMARNDESMRNTPPNKWTEENVKLAELAMEQVKERK